jgi:hypothetical protein
MIENITRGITIALTFTAINQPLTPDIAFDLGYKVGIRNCLYIVPDQIGSKQALDMAIQSLTNEEREVVIKINHMDESLPIVKAHVAGYDKGLTPCKDRL